MSGTSSKRYFVCVTAVTELGVTRITWINHLCARALIPCQRGISGCRDLQGLGYFVVFRARRPRSMPVNVAS